MKTKSVETEVSAKTKTVVKDTQSLVNTSAILDTASSERSVLIAKLQTTGV